MKRAARVVLWVLGGFLVLRAAMEPFVVDVSDPDSYRHDWGGPSLAGVLAVHVLPGVLAAVLMVVALRRRATSAQVAAPRRG